MTPSQRLKILAAVERDLARHARNQALIGSMKRLTLKGKLMVFWNRYWQACITFGLMLLILLVLAALSPQARADTICPIAGEPCKVVILTQPEERMLMMPNGILDTAAQGRALELGQFSVYLKNKIQGSPAGTVLAKPEQKPEPEPKKQD